MSKERETMAGYISIPQKGWSHRQIKIEIIGQLMRLAGVEETERLDLTSKRSGEVPFEKFKEFCRKIPTSALFEDGDILKEYGWFINEEYSVGTRYCSKVLACDIEQLKVDLRLEGLSKKARESFNRLVTEEEYIYPYDLVYEVGKDKTMEEINEMPREDL